MRFFPLLGLFIILLQAGGCTYMVARHGNLEEQVDTWVAQEEYGHALDALGYVGEDHPKFARLSSKRRQVESAAKAYENGVARRARDLTNQGKWAEALETYQKGLANYPQSSLLPKELDKFRERQTNRISELELELLIQEAWLLDKTLPLYRELASVDSESWGARFELNRKEAEAQELAANLTEKGVLALERKDLGLAARTLPLANRISPNEEASRAENTLSRVEAEHVRRVNQNREQLEERQKSEEAPKLLEACTTAYKKKDLQEAQRLMKRLEQIDPDNREVKALQKRVQLAVSKSIEQNHQQGVSLYGRGLYEQAIAHWRKVLELDPENEQARAHLERAQKVVEKLRLLREKQGGVQLSSGGNQHG